ncbi:MAG: hybrid sensor histidine kinase/response regulator [Acidobacteriota bacterium]
MEDQDIVREFLLESNENLTRLDQEIVELEKRPKDTELLASIFRTIHTIKGTCGFLGFTLLEGVAHEAENILSQLRSGQRDATEELISLILQATDATKSILRQIEADGTEGEDRYADLRHRLELASKNVETPPTVTVKPAAVPEPVKAVAVAPVEVPAAVHPPGDSEKALTVSDSAIRVDVGLLDKLMNLVGELVLARNQVLQFNSQREDVALNATSQRLNLITTELQEGVMKTRMQPIGLVWNKLPRLVRDVTHSLGKQVRLEMDGADTELDKTIIEAIKDPLTHLVRNACDHGIERPEDRVRAGKPAQGTLQLRAYHEGGQVNIEISDNGAGMDVERLKQKAIEKGLCPAERAARMSDREALNLIFLPGFSTAKQVTNVSGRGVGMDVVKSNIEKIGGAVDIATQLGEWTTVKLKIPLTLAIIPGLVITSGPERFVIPQVSLLELIRLDASSSGKIEHVHGTPVYRRRGSLLPIAYLADILGLEAAQNDTVNIVVLQAEDRQFGLVVGGVNDTQEIVVKPLGKQMKGLTIYAGATIMGDGRVALILDVLGVGRQSGVLASQRENERAGVPKSAAPGEERQRLLLFRTNSFERLAVPLSIVSRLEEFPHSAIEFTGGSPVVQYRGGILPLIPLDSVLAPGSRDDSLTNDPAQVIVFQDGERHVGIAVDRILDIVEEAVSVRRQSSRSGLLGAAVVGTQVTDFLDLQAVLKVAFGDWFREPGSTHHRGTLLLAEASPFVRGLLRVELEMAGYQVQEAGGVAEALQMLDRGPVDVVLAATNLPGDGPLGMLEAIRKRPGAVRIPVVALSGPEAGGRQPEGFDDCQSKFDRTAMLRSIERLAAAVAPESELQEVS